MLKFCLNLLLAFLGFSLFAQPVQDFVDYYDKEQTKKRSEGKFVNGFEDGEWKYWHKNGNQKEISHYQSGKLHGRVTIFFENGSKQNEGFFKRNLPDSIFSEWYPCVKCKAGESGPLKISGNYDEKVKTGQWIFYYPNGKKYKEEYFINGHPKLVNSWDTSGAVRAMNGNGRHIEFFDEPGAKLWKRISDECTYKDSIPYGDCIYWYRNGKKKEEGKFIAGKREGAWTTWHNNGKLHKKTTFVNGEMEGAFIQYFPNGKTEVSGNYQKGMKNGMWLWYRENGNKDFEGEFKSDREHGRWTYYYTTGEKESYGLFKEGKRDSTWMFLYKTGEKWKQGDYKEDLKNGLWMTWFEDGKKLQEGNYANGKEEGLWTSWYGDGKKKDEGNYKNGLMEGAWAGWYPNGNNNYSGTISGGLKEGEWTFWFVDGKMREKGKYSKGKKQGYWEFYHEIGGMESEGNLVDEKHDGKWTYYYACPECKGKEKGQKMREEHMNKGDLHGKATVWYPGGIIQSETEFNKGIADGRWKQYNKNGMPVMDKLYKDGKVVRDYLEK